MARNGKNNRQQITTAAHDAAIKRIGFLGITADMIDGRGLTRIISHHIEKGTRCIIGYHNLHSIFLYHRDKQMRGFYRLCRVIHIDGMPLIFWARALGLKAERRHRITYMDWIFSFMEQAAQNGWRVFYLGAMPGVAARGADVLRLRSPGLHLETAHGHFNCHPGHPENEAVIRQIKAARPHILLVGMGMPRQEHWIIANHSLLDVPVILTCGGCINYLAGVVPLPPRWLGQVGLEWLFRLLTEPRRLWKRCLWEPWYMVPLFLSDLRKTYGKKIRGG